MLCRKEVRWKRDALFFAVLVTVYFLVQLKFLSGIWYGTDELDIMVLGKGIARGELLYKDLTSQHMPISYYISALFCKLGAATVNQQRIAFYILFAVCWATMVFSYRNYFGKKALILYPFIHCCVIQDIEWGTQILSEHLAGIGAIILLLEFIIFGQKRELKIINCIRISAAILLTFGTIFVAVFPIFYIVLGVLGKEICWKKEDGKLKASEWLILLVRKFFKLFAVVVLPWLVLFSYYVYKNSFRIFIKSAYVLNREIYPKYLTDGFGENVFETLFITPIKNLGLFIVNSFNAIPVGLTYVSILEILLVSGGIIYVVKKIKEDGIVSGVAIAMFLLAWHVRGFFDYHSTAGTEVLAFMMACVLTEHVIGREMQNAKDWLIGMTAIICVYIASGYLGSISIASDINSVKTMSQQTVDSQIVREITEESESIWTVTFANDTLMLADRIPIGTEPTTPWTWEGLGISQFRKLKAAHPRVALMRKDHEVWGYAIKDYAPRVVKYIRSHYTLMEGSGLVWVRNDYYAEAREKLKRIGL